MEEHLEELEDSTRPFAAIGQQASWHKPDEKSCRMPREGIADRLSCGLLARNPNICLEMQMVFITNKQVRGL